MAKLNKPEISKQDMKFISKRRHDHPEKKVRMRLNILWFATQGYSAVQIAGFVGSSVRHVFNIIAMYNHEGLSRIVEINYHKQKSKLDGFSDLIREEFENNPPASVKEVTGKTPYVRFDLNDYSVPHTYVRCTLSVCATLSVVKVMDGMVVIAEHPRSYDKAKQIEDESHISELVDRKKQARQHRGKDRLMHAVPSTSILLKEAAKHNYSLASVTKNLLLLLDDYGAVELEVAIKMALSKKLYHPSAVRLYLQKHREQQEKVPPVRLDLPDDERIRGQVVRPHSLNQYDITNDKDGNDD